MSTFPGKKNQKPNRQKKRHQKGFPKNPLFHFVFAGLLIFSFLIFGASGLSEMGRSKNNAASLSNPFFKEAGNFNTSEDDGIFLNSQMQFTLETPDLKISQDYFVYGVSTPRVITNQTLGAFFGGEPERREVVNYTVQPGDTIKELAHDFNVSVETILWANNLSNKDVLRVGQKIVVLPVSGLVHIVKQGDTMNEIARTYKAKSDEIVSFNGLINEGDIFVGDVLIIPGGIMPSRPAPTPTPTRTRLADNFFIYPAEGYISQGLHYHNAIDVANKCGTPIHAAASGVVQRAVSNGGWNFGMGNHITILHTDGVSTYYGHLSTLFVSPGERVNVGDRIASMGSTGHSTGCHVHFQVMGAANPLAKYPVGSTIRYR